MAETVEKVALSAWIDRRERDRLMQLAIRADHSLSAEVRRAVVRHIEQADHEEELGAVERLVNTPAIRDELLERMDEDAPDVFDVFARVHVKAGTGVAGVRGGGGVALKRPAGRRLDDRFYVQVLRAYDDATSRGKPILRTLMDDSGAPRNTVARWLREAKRREKRLRAESLEVT